MMPSRTLARCVLLLDAIHHAHPLPAARCARKTRRLISIQNKVIKVYMASQCLDEDLRIALNLIGRIAAEFRAGNQPTRRSHR